MNDSIEEDSFEEESTVLETEMKAILRAVVKNKLTGVDGDQQSYSKPQKLRPSKSQQDCANKHGKENNGPQTKNAKFIFQRG